MSTKKHLLQAAAGAGTGGGPWDISTAVFNGSPINWVSVGNQETFPEGLFFKPDGTKMYIVGIGGDIVFQYDLSTAWDISTAFFTSPSTNYLNIVAQDSGPQGLFFKPDGTKMYLAGNSTDSIIEYDLSTAWDISTASYLQSFSVASQETSPEQVWFKPDGTQMYIIGTQGDDVSQYTLSTAWDISTSSYLGASSVAANAPTPNGFFFKDDGTKMYVADSSADNIVEYNLTIAWDYSTISYVQSFSVASEEYSSTGVFFKDDGTKMYVVGTGSDSVNQYNLSTAWNISTASYVQSFLIKQSSSLQEIFFKPDGTKMYISSTTPDAIFSYDLQQEKLNVCKSNKRSTK